MLQALIINKLCNMRPLEILTPFILAVYILWPITGKKRSSSVALLPAFALVLIATHARVEGMRWQMIPIYAFAAATMLTSIPAFFQTQTGMAPTTRPLRVFLSLGLLAVSTALPILLPVPQIPAPSGPYEIGTRIYELTDESREELYSGKDEPRRFQIQVWYPADVAPTDERAPSIEHVDIYAPAISEFFELPSFFLDHLSLVKIPVYKDSTVTTADEGFPIIIFSHGWDGYAAQNSSQVLELVSHGYVVVGMQHTYGAVVTVFDDGTVAKNNPSALPSGAPDDEYETAAKLLGNQWAGDISYALDFLSTINTSVRSPFGGKLDLTRIGVYGHSTGGGAAIQFCGTDTRCKALLGMDPFMRPVSNEIQKSGITQPTFFMFSQKWRDDLSSKNNQIFTPFYAKLSDTYGAVYIEGTAHYDFSDTPLMSPVAAQIGLKGPIKAERVISILNDYLLSFFDATLNGKPTTLFDNPGPYNEVKSK